MYFLIKSLVERRETKYEEESQDNLKQNKLIRVIIIIIFIIINAALVVASYFVSYKLQKLFLSKTVKLYLITFLSKGFNNRDKKDFLF